MNLDEAIEAAQEREKVWEESRYLSTRNRIVELLDVGLTEPQYDALVGLMKPHGFGFDLEYKGVLYLISLYESKNSVSVLSADGLPLNNVSNGHQLLLWLARQPADKEWARRSAHSR